MNYDKREQLSKSVAPFVIQELENYATTLQSEPQTTDKMGEVHIMA